jgi:gliotoxin/aspirochlorine biosynthesis thioredoxin reductase
VSITYSSGRLIHHIRASTKCHRYYFTSMSSAKLYDCLILGGGPAGLAVAQGLSRVHRTCVLFSDSKFRNEGIHASHNILPRDGIHPAEFRKIARE